MAADAHVSIESRDQWPELRKSAILKRGGKALLNEIRQAPPAIQKAVTSELGLIQHRDFLTPYTAWGAVLDVLGRHLPDLAKQAVPLVAEFAAHECEHCHNGKEL